MPEQNKKSTLQFYDELAQLNYTYVPQWGEEDPFSKAGDYIVKDKYKQVSKALRDSKNDAVLDIGCSSGYYLDVIGGRNSLTIGIDISPWVLRKAKDLRSHCDFILSDIDSCSLPFKDGSFDIVFASEIIEHLQYPSKFMQEIFRVVKQDGILLLTTPNRYDLLSLPQQTIEFIFHPNPDPKEAELSTRVREVFKEYEQYGIVAHTQLFSPREIREFFEESGFTEIRIKGLRLSTVEGTRRFLEKRGYLLRLWKFLFKIYHLTGDIVFFSSNILACGRKKKAS